MANKNCGIRCWIRTCWINILRAIRLMDHKKACLSKLQLEFGAAFQGKPYRLAEAVLDRDPNVSCQTLRHQVGQMIIVIDDLVATAEKSRIIGLGDLQINVMLQSWLSSLYETTIRQLIPDFDATDEAPILESPSKEQATPAS